MPTSVQHIAFKCVVRLFLLNESGGVVKKRKTAPLDCASRMHFDELFQLDVDIDRWERSAVLVVLSRFAEDVPAHDDAIGARTPPRYFHCGHVVLGKRVGGSAQRIHWNSALQNPRKAILQWHSLI